MVTRKRSNAQIKPSPNFLKTMSKPTMKAHLPTKEMNVCVSLLIPSMLPSNAFRQYNYLTKNIQETEEEEHIDVPIDKFDGSSSCLPSYPINPVEQQHFSRSLKPFSLPESASTLVPPDSPLSLIGDNETPFRDAIQRCPPTQRCLSVGDKTLKECRVLLQPISKLKKTVYLQNEKQITSSCQSKTVNSPEEHHPDASLFETPNKSVLVCEEHLPPFINGKWLKSVNLETSPQIKILSSKQTLYNGDNENDIGLTISKMPSSPCLKDMDQNSYDNQNTDYCLSTSSHTYSKADTLKSIQTQEDVSDVFFHPIDSPIMQRPTSLTLPLNNSNEESFRTKRNLLDSHELSIDEELSSRLIYEEKMDDLFGKEKSARTIVINEELLNVLPEMQQNDESMSRNTTVCTDFAHSDAKVTSIGLTEQTNQNNLINAHKDSIHSSLNNRKILKSIEIEAIQPISPIINKQSPVTCSATVDDFMRPKDSDGWETVPVVPKLGEQSSDCEQLINSNDNLSHEKDLTQNMIPTSTPELLKKRKLLESVSIEAVLPVSPVFKRQLSLLENAIDSNTLGKDKNISQSLSKDSPTISKVNENNNPDTSTVQNKSISSISNSDSSVPKKGCDKIFVEETTTVRASLEHLFTNNVSNATLVDPNGIKPVEVIELDESPCGVIESPGSKNKSRKRKRRRPIGRLPSKKKTNNGYVSSSSSIHSLPMSKSPIEIDSSTDSCSSISDDYVEIVDDFDDWLRQDAQINSDITAQNVVSNNYSDMIYQDHSYSNFTLSGQGSSTRSKGRNPRRKKINSVLSNIELQKKYYLQHPLMELSVQCEHLNPKDFNIIQISKRKRETLNKSRRKRQNNLLKGKDRKKQNLKNKQRKSGKLRKPGIPVHYQSYKPEQIKTIKNFTMRYRVAFELWPQRYTDALDKINQRIVNQNLFWSSL